MAFVCPKQDEMMKKQATLNAIADIALELKKEFENVYCEPVGPPPPMCCCQCNCPPPQSTPKSVEPSCEPPNVMVCYKVGKAKTSAKTTRKNQGRPNEGQNVIRLKQSKSRELRAGVMYVGCDCEKRNGLQDDCQRTECHGSPECLAIPYPICGPSEFSNGKHLGRPYPTIGGTRTVSGGSYGAYGPGGGAYQQQGRSDNVDTGDCLEYEYQCFPAMEKPDDLDAPCDCENAKERASLGRMNAFGGYYDTDERLEEDDRWRYVGVPACIRNIERLDACQCDCECEPDGPTGRAKYWCRMCNRSLPFGLS